MSTAGFAVIAFLLTMYVLTDGYDLGIAAIVPAIAKNDRERRAVMASIGPFWSGNEVWLIAAGGALFALFPIAYASSFSGFYLPFIVVLWLLMFRGIAMELRDRLQSELWHQFWDVAFSLSSALLIIVFGVAIANLLRGVPLNSYGYFEGTFAFLLNPYALLVGAFALCALALHGAAFAAMRIDGVIGDRALETLRATWWAVLVLYLAVTALTYRVAIVASHPRWLLVMPLLSLAALIALRANLRAQSAGVTFALSTAFLITLLAAAAATLFPYLIPAYPAGHGGISVFTAAPSPAALTCALVVTVGGSIAVLVYGSVVVRRMAGKIRVE